jgi:hypothetical protein
MIADPPSGAFCGACGQPAHGPCRVTPATSNLDQPPLRILDVTWHPNDELERRRALKRIESAKFAGDLKPRDALVDMLRQIDAGEVDPDHLVICYSDLRTEGASAVGYRSAGTRDLTGIVGLLERAKIMLNFGAADCEHE